MRKGEIQHSTYDKTGITYFLLEGGCVAYCYPEEDTLQVVKDNIQIARGLYNNGVIKSIHNNHEWAVIEEPEPIDIKRKQEWLKTQ